MISILSRHPIVGQGTTQLRCIQPAEYLQELGFDVTVNHVWSKVTGKEKVIILHRVVLDSYVRDLIEYARLNGVILVFDTDDLLFTHEGVDYLGEIGMPHFKHEQLLFKEVMELSDVVLVSTSTLQAAAEKFHNDVYLMKNALNNIYVNSATNMQKVCKPCTTLAYLSGSKSHDKDFSVIADVLLSVLQSRSDIKLLVVGPLSYSETFQSLNNFEHRERVSYDEFVRLFTEIDVNLVPLEVEEEFCQCKSELKFLEAGACGIPSIASPTRPYLEVIEHRENSLIARTSEEWAASILELVDNVDLREGLGMAAYKTVCRQYHPEVRKRDWQQLLDKIQTDFPDQTESSVSFRKHYLFYRMRAKLIILATRLKLRNFERIIRVYLRTQVFAK